MNPLLSAALLLLAAQPRDAGVVAFAPPSSASRSPLRRARQLSLFSPLADVSFLISDAADAVAAASTSAAFDPSDAVASAGESSKSFTPTYSRASYYTTLALYVASFPGLWSQIKRSTKAKVKRKTYVRWGDDCFSCRDILRLSLREDAFYFLTPK